MLQFKLKFSPSSVKWLTVLKFSITSEKSWAFFFLSKVWFFFFYEVVIWMTDRKQLSEHRMTVLLWFVFDRMNHVTYLFLKLRQKRRSRRMWPILPSDLVWGQRPTMIPAASTVTSADLNNPGNWTSHSVFYRLFSSCYRADSLTCPTVFIPGCLCSNHRGYLAMQTMFRYTSL